MHSIVNNTAPENLTSRFVRCCDLTSYNLRENEYKLAFPQPRTELTASLKSRCILFNFIILVFILDFRLFRKLLFLYLNVNVPEGNTVFK